MRCILTFLLLLCYSNSFSCLNEYSALDTKDPFHPVEMDRIRFNQAFDQKKIEKQKLKKKETNPEKLLAYIGIKTEREKEEQVETKKADSPEEITDKPKKKSADSMLWIGLTLVVLIISIFTYFKGKKK